MLRPTAIAVVCFPFIYDIKVDQLIIRALDRRWSVVSYGSVRSSSLEFEDIPKDILTDERRNSNAIEVSGNFDNVSGASSCRSMSPRDSVDGSVPQLQVSDPEDSRAPYGEWKSLADDSSDVDMDVNEPSSRDSSVAPPLPPTIPILDLLHPQMEPESASGRLDLEASSSSGVSRQNSPAAEYGQSDSSPRVAPKFPGRARRPSTPEEPPNGRARSSSPPDRTFRRRAAREIVLSSSSQSGHDQSSDEDSDAEAPRSAVRHGVSKAPHPLPRSNTTSRNLPRVESRNSDGAPSPMRRASDCSRQSYSAARSAPVPNPSRNAGTSSEHSESTFAGHTIAFPMGSFARGRRLLVPENRGVPMSTVLMCGEVHFIDQRKRCVPMTFFNLAMLKALFVWLYRAPLSTEFSLRVEDDDFRHVEDACLIGDKTVVVGYDKGPTQVSLITVGDDQVQDTPGS